MLYNNLFIIICVLDSYNSLPILNHHSGSENKGDLLQNRWIIPSSRTPRIDDPAVPFLEPSSWIMPPSRSVIHRSENSDKEAKTPYIKIQDNLSNVSTSLGSVSSELKEKIEQIKTKLTLDVENASIINNE